MTDLFLIAHKVHGEPAFDVATKMECPMCHGGEDPMCVECDEQGWWWIIPTSGHRAYPYANIELFGNVPMRIWFDAWGKEMPPDLPDHYIHKAAPTVSLAEAMGLKGKPAASLPPIVRRL